MYDKNKLLGDCEDCPLGASCKGAIDETGVQAMFGWSQCPKKKYDQNISVKKFARCMFAPACLGGTNTATSVAGVLDSHIECNARFPCLSRTSAAFGLKSIILLATADTFLCNVSTAECRGVLPTNTEKKKQNEEKITQNKEKEIRNNRIQIE